MASIGHFYFGQIGHYHFAATHLIACDADDAGLLYTSGKMNLTRRSLLGMAAAAPLAMAAPAPAVKLGIDLFSLRSQNWTPFQLLDYGAKLGAKVVHFSDIRFIGNLEPENLRAVRRYTEELS